MAATLKETWICPVTGAEFNTEAEANACEAATRKPAVLALEAVEFQGAGAGGFPTLANLVDINTGETGAYRFQSASLNREATDSAYLKATKNNRKVHLHPDYKEAVEARVALANQAVEQAEADKAAAEAARLAGDAAAAQFKADEAAEIAAEATALAEKEAGDLTRG